MTDGWLPLLIGTAIAIAALSYVLYPLLMAAEESSLPARLAQGASVRRSSVRAGDAGTFGSRAEMAEDALREIEFDRATGKLSELDYQELRVKYSAIAAEGGSGGSSAVSEDPVEALVQRAQAQRPVCVSCGARPESDAQFCSECGRRLG